MDDPNIDPALLDPLNFENQVLKNKTAELSAALTSSSFNETETQNLIHYQLETDKILERIEHFLKGDVIQFTKDGSFFAEPTKDVLALAKKDKKGTTYYIQEIEDTQDIEKKTEKLKQIVVKIIDKKDNEIDIKEVDSKKILEKLDKIKLIDEGYKYVSVVDENKKPFNEYGVAELMRIMSMYITKETFLSNYTEDRINEILGDLGDAINNFMYCNYEKMGMDTKFKESKYMIICINLLHTVESCYRRALDGQEQEHLRTRSIVTQNQGGGGNMQGRGPIKKKWSAFDKSTW